MASAKRLHVHSLPVLVLSFGLLTASVIGFQQLVTPHTASKNVFATLFTGHVLIVHRERNGLAEIHWSSQVSASAVVAPVTQPKQTVVLDNTGESAMLSMNVDDSTSNPN